MSAVDPLQRADEIRHRARELSLLHDRAERRHRRSARSPSRRAVDDRETAEGSACNRRVRRHCGPRRRRLERRRPRESVPREHPRNRRGRARRALLRRRERRPRLGQRRSIRDIEVIDTELALADMATIDKALARYKRPAAAGDKDAKALVAELEKCVAQLDQAKPVRGLDLSKAEWASLKPFCLITAKPVLYLANVKEAASRTTRTWTRFARTQWQRRRRSSRCARRSKPRSPELDDADKKEFLADLGLDEPGLNRLIRAGYKLLGLQTYFTPGVKEVRAWTIHVGDTAPRRPAHPHRLRARLHPRADDRLRRLHRVQGRTGRERSRQDARRRQGIRRQGRDVLNSCSTSDV